MRVLIPSALRSYTGERSWVDADGETLAEMLADLDAGKVSSLYQLLGDLRQALHSGGETEDEVAAAAQ